MGDEKCHYCPEPATTKDHIVARVWIRGLIGLPQRFYQLNLVPCCYSCNQRKKHFRSDCRCARCTYAWEQIEERLLPVPPLVNMLNREEELVDDGIQCERGGD